MFFKNACEVVIEVVQMLVNKKVLNVCETNNVNLQIKRLIVDFLACLK